MYFRQSLTTGIADSQFFFGDPGDRFVSGDWGIVDRRRHAAVFRPSNTTFFFRHSNTQGNADESIFWGQSHLLPVSGSWTRRRRGRRRRRWYHRPPPVARSVTTVTGITQRDCQALLALYAATGGNQWTNKTGWGVTKTPCSWFGVGCIGNRVTSLILEQSPNDPGNNLVGTLPSALGNLTGLTRLTSPPMRSQRDHSDHHRELAAICRPRPVGELLCQGPSRRS